MYFFDGSDVCLNVIPALAEMSSSCGTGRLAHLAAFAPGGGGAGALWPACACAKFVTKRIRKNKPAAAREDLAIKQFSIRESSWMLHRLRRAVSRFRLEILVDLELAIRVRDARIFAVRGLVLVVHVIRIRG